MSQQRIAERELVGFGTSLIVGDGDAPYNTSAEVAAIIEANTTNTAFTLIWEQTVPAQQVFAWGSGSARAQRNQGFMHFFALDVGTGFEEGTLRLAVSNARGTRIRIVKELNTQRLHTTVSTTAITATPTDINTMVALPEQVAFPKVGQDSLMQMYFRTSIVTTTVDACEFSIPATIYQ